MADPTAAPPASDDTGEPIPLSALQHAVYCLRQAALIHLERLWADNRLTAEGSVLHAVADAPGGRWARGVRRVHALPLGSRRLGIAGVADVVEFRKGEDGEVPYPVEIKRGKPKRHRADEVQLCAQALCLEEMLGIVVPEGALFYAEPKRRTPVRFDADLRAATESVIADLRTLFAARVTPPPTPHRSRCRACSLLDLCRPDTVGRGVRAWRARMVENDLSLAAESRIPP